MRPVYVACELVVAAAATGGYSVVSDSVSTLGEIGCTADRCSPLHPLMNGSFIGFGALLALGAVLLARPLGTWVAVLLVVSGLSSIATGLAPLDQDTTRHALAATPLFVAQPLALVVLGRRLRHRQPLLARSLLTTGVVTGASAAAFLLLGDSPVSGAVERVALWPVLVALAAVAWTSLRARDRPTST